MNTLRNITGIMVAVMLGITAAAGATVAEIRVLDPIGSHVPVQVTANVETVAYITAPHNGGQERFCKYFPPGRSWAYSSARQPTWRKVITAAPRQFDASMLNLWIEGHGEHKDPGYRFRRVHKECNP